MSVSGVVGVWCEPKAAAPQIAYEAHFNYWRLAGGGGSRGRHGRRTDNLEIGLMVDDVAQLEALRVFLPFVVERGTVTDCSKRLEQARFAQGIFNEVLAVKCPAPGAAGCVELLDETSSVFCGVHRFGNGRDGIDAAELALDPCDHGTVMTITGTAISSACPAPAAASKTYFRLRIALPAGDANPFIRVMSPSDRRMQSGFDEIEYIDFRMNEARTLPPAVERRMGADRRKGKGERLGLVAFLTAVPVLAELSVANLPSHKMRLLEPSWSEYVDDAIDGNMVVYHWKRDDRLKPITDFTAFVKMQTRRSGRRIIREYLWWTLGMALAGNLIAAMIIAAATSALHRTDRDDRCVPPSACATPPGARDPAITNGSAAYPATVGVGPVGLTTGATPGAPRQGGGVAPACDQRVGAGCAGDGATPALGNGM